MDTIKTNCIKLWLLIQGYAQFQFPRKGSMTSFCTTFCIWLFKNVSHVTFYYWPYFIVWSPLFLKIFDNIYITIAREPGCDFIKFEIKLIFLIKLFCCMTKKSRQKLKYLEKKNSCWGEKKTFFIIFKWLSIVKNCLRPESVPLSYFCFLCLMKSL